MVQATVRTVADAVATLNSSVPSVPDTAFLLGSGVQILEELDEASSWSYSQIFGISPSIAGHNGSVTVGKLDGHNVAVLRGRFHLYEGHDWEIVTLPVKVLAAWGVRDLYLTNAAGGIHPDFRVGDLMLLVGYRDHLHPDWRETGLIPALKKPATSAESALTSHLWSVGEKLCKEDPSFRPLQKGVYAALLGPNYETLAEIEMLRRLKADAVGMSTAPELQAIKGTNVRAAAISVITNVWRTDEAIHGHEEVLRAAQEASRRLERLFRAALTSGCQ